MMTTRRQSHRARPPTRKEMEAPSTSSQRWGLSAEKECLASRKKAPAMAGREARKEYLNAVARSRPRARPELMEAPERACDRGRA